MKSRKQLLNAGAYERDAAMADHSVLGKLAWLASLAAQERYIVHSRKDEYLIPEELLMDAMGVVEAVQQNRIGLPKLSESQRAAILRFGEVLRSAYPTYNTGRNLAAELVRDAAPWARVREAARECLAVLNIDLAAWEQEKGLSEWVAETESAWIGRQLAPLASLEYQEPYSSNTFHLLDSVARIVRGVRENVRWIGKLSASERAAILRFGEHLDPVLREFNIDLTVSLSHNYYPVPVHHRAPWAGILRDPARECLLALGFDLDQWKKEVLHR